jgi:hypothetical protein
MASERSADVIAGVGFCSVLMVFLTSSRPLLK